MAELELAPDMMAAPNIRLVRKLRDGGMGSVWIGEHQALKTSVAVKFMLLEVGKKKDASSRFSREASAAARIRSPHVVQVLDHGINSHELAYIVMELLEGEDLGTRLATLGTIPFADVVTIVSHSAKALSKAHANGIVHRDIKPDNIFLTDVEGDLFVKVLDFGIAKQEDDASMTMTSTGVMMGTPFYMAPEQMTNAKDAVPASDLWSLAVVAYHALTGTLPFPGETVAGIAVAIERGKFTPPSTLVPGLSDKVDGWFSRAFQHEARDRFSSAKELADELVAIAYPGGRRSIVSDLLVTSVQPVPSIPQAARSAPTHLPTQMGSTLDGTAPRAKKRGLAFGVGAVALVAGVLVGAYLFIENSKASARPSAGPEAAIGQVKHDDTPPASSGPEVSPLPANGGSASPGASSSASETTARDGAAPVPIQGEGVAPTASIVPPRPSSHPTGKWPPPRPSASAVVPPKKDRGF